MNCRRDGSDVWLRDIGIEIEQNMISREACAFIRETVGYEKMIHTAEKTVSCNTSSWPICKQPSASRHDFVYSNPSH